MTYAQIIEQIERNNLIDDFNAFANLPENQNLHIIQIVGKYGESQNFIGWQPIATQNT